MDINLIDQITCKAKNFKGIKSTTFMVLLKYYFQMIKTTRGLAQWFSKQILLPI